MRIAIVIAMIGLLSMSLIIFIAFRTGNFFEEGKLIVSLPWGIVSMIDLYTGFILFSMWIIYREKSFIKYSPWVLGMLILGFFTGSLYVLITLIKSRGNWDYFWKGDLKTL